MISLVFRCALIICSVLTSTFMIKKIRNSKLQIEHAIFWLLFAFILIILSIFPQITIWEIELMNWHKKLQLKKNSQKKRKLKSLTINKKEAGFFL